MALTNDEIIEELSNKSIMEVVEIVKALEEKWGVSAAAAVAVAAGPAAADAGAAQEEKN
jgi:large subunit ribosomal protein L7/L12